MSARDGQALLQAKLQLLRGNAPRTANTALNLLVGRTALAEVPRPVGPVSMPRLLAVGLAATPPLHVVVKPLRTGPRRRTVYLAQQHIDMLDALCVSCTGTQRRQSRSALIRRAIEHLANQVEQGQPIG